MGWGGGDAGLHMWQWDAQNKITQRHLGEVAVVQQGAQGSGGADAEAPVGRCIRRPGWWGSVILTRV